MAQKFGVDPGVLHTFQRAAAIRDALFRSGGMQPAVRFELEPVTMGAAINQLILDLDGQQLTYGHGLSHPVVMQWSSVNGLGVVRLTVTPPPSSGHSGLIPEGPWAWFHLFGQSNLERDNSPDRFTLRLCVNGSSIVCELRASSAFNPFKSRVVSGFNLPERL